MGLTAEEARAGGSAAVLWKLADWIVVPFGARSKRLAEDATDQVAVATWCYGAAVGERVDPALSVQRALFAAARVTFTDLQVR